MMTTMTIFKHNPRAMGAVLRLLVLVLFIFARIGEPATALTPTGGRAAEWWIVRWGLIEAWKVSRGSGVTVAVIDTGVQASVAGMQGAVLPGIDLTKQGSDGRTDSSQDGHGTAI